MRRASLVLLLALASIPAHSLAACFRPGCYSVYGDWGWAISDQYAYATTPSDDSSQTLAFACSLKAGRCQWEVTLSGADCRIGSKTKVFLSGSVSAGEVGAICAAPSSGRDGRTLLFPVDNPSLVHQAMTSGDVVVATQNADGRYVRSRFHGAGAAAAVAAARTYLSSRMQGESPPPDSDSPPDVAELRDEMIRQCIRGALDRQTVPAPTILAAYYCNCLSQRLLFGSGLEERAMARKGEQASIACMDEGIRWLQEAQAKAR